MERLIEVFAKDLDVIGTLGLARATDLAVAVFCGALLGYDRRLHRSAAGMKTCALVCAGAVMYTQIGHSLLAMPGVSGDPTRIAGQIVTGIGFLGAGAILRVGRSVSGLTSAAVIWFLGAVGILIGCGYPISGTLITINAMLFLRAVAFAERKIFPKWAEVERDDALQ